MSFVRRTGQRRRALCPTCGASCPQEEVQNRGTKEKSWSPLAHRAPCGAHCLGGGVNYREEDVHVPHLGRCPRCGEEDAEIVETIEKDDGSERVVIYQYLRRQNYCIGLEKKVAHIWEKKGFWPTDSPSSLEGTIRWAKHYFPWVPAK